MVYVGSMGSSNSLACPTLSNLNIDFISMCNLVHDTHIVVTFAKKIQMDRFVWLIQPLFDLYIWITSL